MPLSLQLVLLLGAIALSTVGIGTYIALRSGKKGPEVFGTALPSDRATGWHDEENRDTDDVRVTKSEAFIFLIQAVLTLVEIVLHVIVGSFLDLDHATMYLSALGWMLVIALVGNMFSQQKLFELTGDRFKKLNFDMKGSRQALLLRHIDAHRHIPGVDETLASLTEKFENLAKGEFEYDNWQTVYRVKMRTVEEMRAPDRLRATVPTGQKGGFKSIETQFGDSSFQAYVQAQKRARKNGVCIQRLYFFEAENALNKKITQAHLRDLIEAGIEVKYLLEP